MRTGELRKRSKSRTGFILPVVLILAGGMLAIAIAVLMLARVERITARQLVDRQRAELAADAALESLKTVLQAETSNDDYVVVKPVTSSPSGTGPDPASHLFIARGKLESGRVRFRYVPLFSCDRIPEESSSLVVPDAAPLVMSDGIAMDTLPYQEETRVGWRVIRNAEGRAVSRFAYVVEDLQARLDPRLVGNLNGSASGGLCHVRASGGFSAPGLNPVTEEQSDIDLDQVALYAIDPEADEDAQGELGKTLIQNRRLMISPGSPIAGAGVAPPLVRGVDGHLVSPLARAAEENLIASLRSYDEQPLIPAADGIDPGWFNKPKMNLNALLALSPDEAVEEMARMIGSALPAFVGRKGGFPDDYLKTLAANCIDYADADSEPTVRSGQYRGIDAMPLLSEIALQVGYEGMVEVKSRRVAEFRLRLFAELFNPTTQPVSGQARLSYEVALAMDGVGSSPGSGAFDSPGLLCDPERTTHDLSEEGDRFWTRSVFVSLRPNQYGCYQFADVSYRIDLGAISEPVPATTPFSLLESRGASGLSFKWNGKEIERLAGIIRQQGLIYSKKNGVATGGFRIGVPRTITKAALPGLVYDDFPDSYYNMGDARISHYLRGAPLAENAYPENASPNRRNIRRGIYDADAPAKPKVYARVLPSEWPDGGHDAGVGDWSPGASDKTFMTAPLFALPYDEMMAFAVPQEISNRGKFLSVTELGRVFDPVMHTPSFGSAEETQLLCGKGRMPDSQSRWPDVRELLPSQYYGGGNTLRIGRPEHSAFNLGARPGMSAARLLDLFHVGRSRSSVRALREGPLVRINGHVNINTAARDVLRAMAAGILVRDPLLGLCGDRNHVGVPVMAPRRESVELAAPFVISEADRIADAVIRGRPYISVADLAHCADENGGSMFGNRDAFPGGSAIQWSDAAAEEIFARVYEGSTVRSRNFRIWIVAQALSSPSGPRAAVRVSAEVRRVCTVFADPGERTADGSIKPGEFRVSVTSRNEF